jgi:hypothetical protein
MMDDNTQGNAMTEIALALAMSFFSLMVLTMVSMGAGGGGAQQKSNDIRGATFAAPIQHASKSESAGAAQAGPDDLLLIHHNGRLLDRELRPVDPSQLPADRRVILALNPSLSLAEAMSVRASIAHRDLIVTHLDARWMQRLQGGLK